MKATSVTIVLEWDNAEGLERDKALYFLQRLSATIRDSAASIPRPVTLLLVFDDGVDQADLRKMLAECADTMRGSLAPKLLYAPDADYYEKKGVAPYFQQTDILVYADSDCRYSENWLEDILAPLLTGRADLAFGDTIALEDGSVMGKTSALAWFFPIRSDRDPLLKKGVRRFFANNFAVRRTVLEQVPIPRLDAARAHGAPWFVALQNAGIRTEKVSCAIAEHKQYDNFGEFMGRAWMLGKDKDAGIGVAGGSRPYRMWRALLGVAEMNAKFLRRYFTVGLTRVNLADAVPVFVGGVLFQLVGNLSQMVASATRKQASISTDYADIISTTIVLNDQPGVNESRRAA